MHLLPKICLQTLGKEYSQYSIQLQMLAQMNFNKTVHAQVVQSYIVQSGKWVGLPRTILYTESG